MMILKPLSLLVALFVITHYLVEPTSAKASMVVGGWWGGSWTCKIDGRPAKMKWQVAENSEQSCDDDGICSSTSAVTWRGSFSDNGSQWVQLTNLAVGKKGGIFFRHADGNQWYLGKPVNNNTSGWTTWNGARYPLSCSR